MDAIQSLQDIGAPILAGHLKSALVGAFGPRGPQCDRERRLDQIAALDKAQDEAIEDFDERLDKGPEPIETLLMRFALEHQDEFKPRTR